MPTHSLTPGLSHEATMRVGAGCTVPRFAEFEAFQSIPAVLASARLVAFIEATAIDCVREHLADGECTVGTGFELSHQAPSLEGMRVRVRVELLAVDGRSLRFRVQAADDAGSISEGHHQRAVVPRDRFMEAARARRNQAVL